ncbi:succinate dehydrogenase, hydrophobic membrane anchor protein [candidate division LCP-89 bacterium B3_LCP]|uniref:Succinate dehydrogenase hydrophobic membrane anchor subunit n=1 Tax=candidate division LCP-89 bacterium B3_LCP TaxID=2012998 RepID=A0A532UUC2_UNCL8|nr:MAG: succinate dehydrogenase, hydrophobic membrane anchor protein [candidate division LCP-89 bacterium B3_LCP]
MKGDKMDRGIGSGGAFAWFFQRISGVFLLVALLAHFWVLHYVSGGDVTFQIVAQRLATPIWKTIDLAFLVLAIIHGFNGFIMVIHDYIHNHNLRLVLVSFIWIAGIVLGLLGTITIISFQAPAGGGL